MIHHLVTGIEEGPERQIECFGNTHRYDHLVFRAIIDAEILADIAGNLLPQFE